MKIKVSLSRKGILDAIDQIKKYQESLNAKATTLAQRISEYGVEVARVKVADFDAILSGELLSSIHSEYIESNPHGAVFAIRCDSEHAVFVEFGTGEKGMKDPAKHLPDGLVWDYNVGQTIKTHPDGTHYWFYPGDDGQWHYTQGMPSRPFMYETGADLYKDMQMIVKIAKEVFRS